MPELTPKQIHDAKRRREQPWRKWYFTKAWQYRRLRQFAAVPWCEPCKVMGRSRPATICNHKVPHRGDYKLFFEGALESTCKECHDSAIQRAELEGFTRDVDGEGWPTDPLHPFNRKNGRSALILEALKREPE